MEPITIIIGALVAGATAVGGHAGTDAYNGLKTLIQRKYASVSLSTLEKLPDSKTQKEAVTESLTLEGADKDPEVLDEAKKVLAVVEEHEPGRVAALGLDLNNVKAVNLRVQEVESEGIGVRISEGEFSGDIDLGSIRAGVNKNPPER